MDRCRRCNHREIRHQAAGRLRCRGTFVIMSGNRVACMCDGYVEPSDAAAYRRLMTSPVGADGEPLY